MGAGGIIGLGPAIPTAPKLQNTDVQWWALRRSLCAACMPMLAMLCRGYTKLAVGPSCGSWEECLACTSTPPWAAHEIGLGQVIVPPRASRVSSE